MKQILILAALPIVAYCQSARSDLFTFSEKEDEYLHHIEVEMEPEETFDQTQSLSLLEIDEGDESLIPWSAEDLACDDFDIRLERRAAEIYEEFEDVFAYEMPCYGEGIPCKPTYEKVTEERKRLFHRPKVIESTPQKKEAHRPVAKNAPESSPHR